MKLLLDEMLPESIAQQLRACGYDAIAVQENPGLRGSTDRELFEVAQEDGRTLVTYNREDFLALDREFRRAGREHHGIVVCHPRRFPQRTETIRPLMEALGRLVEKGRPYPAFVHWLQTSRD